MTRKTLLSLAATLVAATTFSGFAEAGNGVRLNFGGPLGSFEAKPSRGGAVASNSYSGHKEKCAPKASTRHASHQEVQRPAPRKKQEVAAAPRKVERDEPKVTRNKRDSKPKTEVAAVETTVAETEVTTLTGSRALAAQDAAEPTTTAAETTPTTETTTETDTETKSETVTETASISTDDKEPAAKSEVAEVKEVTEAEATKTADAKDVGCKKFIPAIGVTVSVGCGK